MFVAYKTIEQATLLSAFNFTYIEINLWNWPCFCGIPRRFDNDSNYFCLLLGRLVLKIRIVRLTVAITSTVMERRCFFLQYYLQ